MLDEKLKNYAILGLLAGLLSLGASYFNKVRYYQEREATIVEAKRKAELAMLSAVDAAEQMKASLKKSAAIDKHQKVTVLPDGTRIEELTEKLRNTEELWAETSRAYTERIEVLEAENEQLKQAASSVKIETSKPAFKPFALGLSWIGAPKASGAMDLDLGYHFDFGAFDLGPHVGTALAGEKALAPLDERAYRFGVQGRF